MARYYGVPLRNGLPLGLGSVLSLRKPGGAAAAVPDPYFEYTTLLLPGNGTNGAQNNTFLDSSSNAFSITRSGNATQGTFSPFSQTGWGNYFGSSGSYLTLADATQFNLSGGNYTLECWIFPNGNYADYNTILAKRVASSSTTAWEIFLNISTGVLSYFDGTIRASAVTPPSNQWSHVAAVYDGTNINLYLNGTRVLQTAVSNTNQSASVYVGAYATAEQFLGYISNVRITKGAALYTGASFTVPTTALTTTVSSGTVSLLTCQSNRFVDNSTNAAAITVSGSPSIQAFSPFNPTAAWSAATNGGSAYFDGSGDRVQTASTSAAFDLGSGNWTIEAWVYFTTVTSYATIAYCSLSNVDGHGLTLVTTSAFAYYINGSLAINSGVAPVAGRWYHVAAVRNSGTTTLYVNGVSTGTTATAPTSKNYYFSSGLKPNDIEPLTGYVSDARVVKGTAVYTANFTPPTAPLTAITNTSILCNFTNAGIYDATSKNDLETVGNAQISTTQSKFGGSSMYFDGTGDWLAAPLTENLKFGTGDFTIEGWFYNSAAQQSASGIFSYLAGATYFVMHNNAGGYANKLSIWVDAYAGTPIIVGSTTLVQDTWYHFAISRASGVWRLFLNGTQEGSNYTNSAEPVPANSQLRIALGNNSGGFGGYTGYMDDFRVTKGYARYTANFTPPTTAFPLL